MLGLYLSIRNGLHPYFYRIAAHLSVLHLFTFISSFSPKSVLCTSAKVVNKAIGCKKSPHLLIYFKGKFNKKYTDETYRT